MNHINTPIRMKYTTQTGWHEHSLTRMLYLYELRLQLGVAIWCMLFRCCFASFCFVLFCFRFSLILLFFLFPPQPLSSSSLLLLLSVQLVRSKTYDEWHQHHQTRQKNEWTNEKKNNAKKHGWKKSYKIQGITFGCNRMQWFSRLTSPSYSKTKKFLWSFN